MRITTLLLALTLTLTGTAQVVDATPEKQYKTGKVAINYIDVAPNGLYMVVGTSENAFVYDPSSGKKLYTLDCEDNRHDKSVFLIVFDETGNYCATIGRYGSRKIWDLTSGEEIEKSNSMHWLPTPTDLKRRMLITKNTDKSFPYQQKESVVPGKSNITASSSNASVKFYDATAETTVQTIKFEKVKNKTHQPPIFFYEGYLVTGADNGTINFYKVN